MEWRLGRRGGRGRGRMRRCWGGAARVAGVWRTGRRVKCWGKSGSRGSEVQWCLSVVGVDGTLMEECGRFVNVHGTGSGQGGDDLKTNNNIHAENRFCMISWHQSYLLFEQSKSCNNTYTTDGSITGSPCVCGAPRHIGCKNHPQLRMKEPRACHGGSIEC